MSITSAKEKLQNYYRDFILDAIEEVVSTGGERVPEELTKLRITQGCKNCELFIIGEVLPNVMARKCGNGPPNDIGCGCALDVKSKFKKHRDPKTLKIIDTTCPKEVWSIIDNNFYKINKDESS